MFPKRQRKRKKSQSVDELLEEFSKELKPCQSERQRKKDIVVRFKRDESGNRQTHTKYRDRSLSRKAACPGPCTSKESAQIPLQPIGDHDVVSGCLEAPTTEDQLENILNDVEEALGNWDGKKSRSWCSRMEALNSTWEDHRKDIMEHVLTIAGNCPAECCRCMSVGSDIVIRCVQCGPGNMCTVCDDVVHSKLPLHDREIFIEGYYRPVPPSQTISQDGIIKSIRRHLPYHVSTCPLCENDENICERFKSEKCTVITLRGRYDLEIAELICSKCNLLLSQWNLKTIIGMGYWPSSPTNLTTVFNQELFEYWDILQKSSPGVSERSFLSSLQEFSLNKGRVGVLNTSSFNRAFKEWKFCKFELEKIAGKDWMDCPACSISQHSGHVDGNMKLYRFISAGRRQRDCYYGETFIASSKNVEQHTQQLQNLGYSGNIDRNEDMSSCGESQWKAGQNTARKRRNLDETGLEILGCRHSIAQKAISMHRGEIYSYAHFLQTKYLIPRGAEYFWYDVVCMYWPWLTKNGSNAVEKMKPALSVMHAKAHSWSCQVLFGGRWQPGAACTSGEEVEQINSHFSRLGNTTKHMLPEGREELLTEHALSWNKRKIKRMAWYLTSRYAKTKEKLRKTIDEKDDLLKSIGCADVYDAEKWIEELKKVAQEEDALQRRKACMTAKQELFVINKLCSNTPLSPESFALLECVATLFPRRYCLLEKNKTNETFIKKLQSKNDINQSIDVGVEQGLKNVMVVLLQRKIQTHHFNIVQIAFNMGKLADSSKKRKRMRGKIQSQKNTLGKLVGNYNGLSEESLNILDAENGVFPWLPIEEDQSIPIKHMRQVADVEMEVRRTKEEIILIEEEMIRYIMYYKNIVLPKLNEQRATLEKYFAELDASQDIPVENTVTVDAPNEESTYTSNIVNESVIKGKISITRLGINFCYQQLHAALMMFRQVKEFDEEHLEDHLSRLAEELGLEESSNVGTEQFENDNYSDDSDDSDASDDSDSCHDDIQ